jgi:predicted 3-demethylubiquinone-9 3-methyltransferase (glyoxalase superfamily)
MAKITPFLPDPEQAKRAMEATLTMKKLDIEALKAAAAAI